MANRRSAVDIEGGDGPAAGADLRRKHQERHPLDLVHHIVRRLPKHRKEVRVDSEHRPSLRVDRRHRQVVKSSK